MFIFSLYYLLKTLLSPLMNPMCHFCKKTKSNNNKNKAKQNNKHLVIPIRCAVSVKCVSWAQMIATWSSPGGPGGKIVKP